MISGSAPKLSHFSNVVSTLRVSPASSRPKSSDVTIGALVDCWAPDSAIGETELQIASRVLPDCNEKMFPTPSAVADRPYSNYS